MTAKQIFLWGVVGAAIPVFAKIALIDPKTALSAMPPTTTLIVIFMLLYVLKTLGALIVGGVIAFWKGGVNPDRATLIFLGMSAPAMIGMLLTGNQVDKATETKSAYMVDYGVVEAAESLRFKPLSFESQQPGLIDTAKQALLDSKPQNTLYLIISERETLEAAQEFATQMCADLEGKGLLKHEDGKPDLSCEVYAPYKVLKYSIVLGERLNHDDADYLVKKLLSADFKDVRIFNLSTGEYEDKK